MRSAARAWHKSSGGGSLLVHCSAGVGRAGTFIAVDYAITELESTHNVDVLKVVSRLRKDRNGMVQTFEQAEFAQRAAIAHARGECSANPILVCPTSFPLLLKLPSLPLVHTTTITGYSCTRIPAHSLAQPHIHPSSPTTSTANTTTTTTTTRAAGHGKSVAHTESPSARGGYVEVADSTTHAVDPSLNTVDGDEDEIPEGFGRGDSVRSENPVGFGRNRDSVRSAMSDDYGFGGGGAFESDSRRSSVRSTEFSGFDRRDSVMSNGSEYGFGATDGGESITDPGIALRPPPWGGGGAASSSSQRSSGSGARHSNAPSAHRPPSR
jgi:hypothetical protein